MKMVNDIEKIKEGLERAYERLIEYKKYKKTPLIVSKGGEIIEISPEKIVINHNAYK